MSTLVLSYFFRDAALAMMKLLSLVIMSLVTMGLTLVMLVSHSIYQLLSAQYSRCSAAPLIPRGGAALGEFENPFAAILL